MWPFSDKAPELKGITHWINSKPLKIEELRGKVVLVDFWDYTCVNCIRTLPYIQKWHEKYADKGLVIIAVHAPEFEFEKAPENVKKAAKKFGLTYPIALDNDFATWRAFHNNYWPAKYMIDKEGKLVYHHYGEGHYEQTEKKIQELLGIKEKTESETTTIRGAITPETYAGSDRNPGIGSSKVCTKEGCDEYVDPPKHERGIIYLKGEWEQQPQFLEAKKR